LSITSINSFIKFVYKIQKFVFINNQNALIMKLLFYFFVSLILRNKNLLCKQYNLLIVENTSLQREYFHLTQRKYPLLFNLIDDSIKHPYNNLTETIHNNDYFFNPNKVHQQFYKSFMNSIIFSFNSNSFVLLWLCKFLKNNNKELRNDIMLKKKSTFPRPEASYHSKGGGASSAIGI